jgi:hypothetical protein
MICEAAKIRNALNSTRNLIQTEQTLMDEGFYIDCNNNSPFIHGLILQEGELYQMLIPRLCQPVDCK